MEVKNLQNSVVDGPDDSNREKDKMVASLTLENHTVVKVCLCSIIQIQIFIITQVKYYKLEVNNL